MSPDGNDKNPGTIKKPFATIEAARNAVRNLDDKTKQDIIVFLRGGRYELKNTVLFDHRDSGRNGYRIVYKAFQDERPIISGGREVKNWTPVENGLFKAHVDIEFRQFYVNGRRAIRARTPNSDEYYRLKFWNKRNREIIIDKNLIQDWKNFDQIEMIVHMHWAEAILPLASYEQFGDYAYVAVQKPERDLAFRRMYPIKSENEAFHFENALEFLDQPGEWYHDKSTNELYYLPRPGEKMTTAEAIIPQLETLVKIKGTLDEPVHHLTFEGVTFSHSGWILPRDTGMLNCQAGHYSVKVEPNNVQYFARPPAAVYVAVAHHLKFENNELSKLGSTALDFHYGTHDDLIVGNIFYDISGTGIMLAKFSEADIKHTHLYNPEDQREICKNDTISNNVITKIGQDYPGCCGIACGFPQGVVIEHNELFDMPYTGISVGWGWTDADNAMRDNQIRYNHIHHVLKLLCDGGGIYTLSKQPNSSIKENYIHDIYRSQWAVGSQVNGIFLDEGTNGYTLDHNVFENIQEEQIRHNRTSTIILIKNYTKDQQVIENSGLKGEYKKIKTRITD
ncbi:right-handed parallel beta-helix repeat-containing protein [candidate division KSB1 bacterium]|nr:right-handed parallel beta-helix repeat-containing protein [candidate division KSB1 bacterium]